MVLQGSLTCRSLARWERGEELFPQDIAPGRGTCNTLTHTPGATTKGLTHRLLRV
jgi:hypothetical protein